MRDRGTKFDPYRKWWVVSWFLYSMVAQNTLRTDDVKKVFPQKIGFDHSFDLPNYLRQIEIPNLLRMCAQ